MSVWEKSTLSVTGMPRDVASRADTAYYALRGLLSVEYYYERQTIGEITTDEPKCSMPGFVYDTTENGFYRFRNTAYVPMGFTFSNYIAKGKWNSTSTSYRSNLLMRALVLSSEQIEKYGSWMQPVSDSNVSMTEEEYLRSAATVPHPPVTPSNMIPAALPPPSLWTARTWYFSAFPTMRDGLPPSTENRLT